MSELALFAKITPKPQHRAAAETAIRGILGATRAEPGCRRFSLHAGDGADEALYLYEIWDDEAALAAHYAAPYTQAVFEAYRDWLAAPVEIVRLRRLD